VLAAQCGVGLVRSITTGGIGRTGAGNPGKGGLSRDGAWEGWLGVGVVGRVQHQPKPHVRGEGNPVTVEGQSGLGGIHAMQGATSGDS